MRILLIEDDEKISGFLAENLALAGFTVEVAFDGGQGFRLAKSNSYDLLIVDIMLPTIDGLKVVSDLRDSGVTSKILILSAKRLVDDKVSGLQSGADDYLEKPFAYAELLARCQALLRRPREKTSETRIEAGEMILNLVTREAFRGDRRIELQSKEFNLLEYFLRHPDQILSKSQILKRIWRYNFDPQTNVVDVLVCRLRNKVDRADDFKCIRTVRGVGYVYKTT